MVGTFRTTIFTLSCVKAQGGLLILQRKVFVPSANPVIVVVGLFGETIVPAPAITLQTPVPAVGVLAAIVADEVTQTVWSGPAAAIEGTAFVIIVMFETEEAQGGLLMDHVSTVIPGVNPVTVVFRTNGFVIVPEPETKTHIPVPLAGLFPFNVAVAVPVVAHKV